MIKILHLITDLSTGGAETMLYKLITHIDRTRFNNVVVSMTDKGTFGNRIESIGIPVFALGMQRGLPNPIGLLRLLRLLKKEQPQILQTWLYHADLLGIIAAKIAKIQSIIWNLRCSELDKNDHPKSLFFILYLLAKLSRIPKAVIINSKTGQLFHERMGYKAINWKLIPNGFDINLFRPSNDSRIIFRQKLGVSEQTFLIGLVARYHPMKDHLNLLKAASLLFKIKPDVHFVFAGQGVDERNKGLVETIKEIGIASNVHLMGKRKDIQYIISALDIAVSSSYSEGFPNAIGEAMACGVPCVVTDVGDSAYIVGDTGIVVPPRDPHAMANALEKLLSMGAEERSALGLAARERIISHFSIEAVTKQYENLYYEITSNR